MGRPGGPGGPAAGRLRILFLGNAYNLLSVACLVTLLEDGHEVVLGQHDAAAAGSRPALVARTLRRRGLTLLARKAARLVRCRLRAGLRRIGVPLRGFASLPEVLAAHPIPVIPSNELTGPELPSRVRGAAFDLLVVAGFSRILKEPLLGLPRLAAVNVHLSLLPRYRGPAPQYWVLANGEPVTGATIHHLDSGIDSGDIIARRELAIRPGETERTLHPRLVALAAGLLRETLPRIADGSAPRTPQDHARASYFSFPPKGAATLF